MEGDIVIYKNKLYNIHREEESWELFNFNSPNAIRLETALMGDEKVKIYPGGY